MSTEIEINKENLELLRRLFAVCIHDIPEQFRAAAATALMTGRTVDMRSYYTNDVMELLNTDQPPYIYCALHHVVSKASLSPSVWNGQEVAAIVKYLDEHEHTNSTGLS